MNLDSQTLQLGDIQKGREGWVYLIHAVGTNRYKIGRSANPVARHRALQNQSPYPLKIVDSFWTVDTPTDEAYWHESLSKYRVRGEWFELSEADVKNHLTGFCVGSVVGMAIRRGWFKSFLEELLTDYAGNPINHKFTKTDFFNIDCLFSRAYDTATERQHLEQMALFVTNAVPKRVKSSFYDFEQVVFEELYYYVLGLTEAFVLLIMQKELL